MGGADLCILRERKIGWKIFRSALGRGGTGAAWGLRWGGAGVLFPTIGTPSITARKKDKQQKNRPKWRRFKVVRW